MELSLLRKYFENRCSPEEVEEIQRWIEDKSAALDLEENFKTTWETLKVKPGDYHKWSGMLHQVHEKIEMEELYASIANSERGKANSRIFKNREPIRGYEASSRSTRFSRKYVIGGLLFLVIFAVSLFWKIDSPNASEELFEVSEVSKITEPGQKLSFHLNDGSQVILNASSKLMYPEIFSDQERIVFLEGEAFFDVSKDSLRPFRVVTGTLVTTALGTSFNVKAFPTDEEMEISLVSGKVVVSEDQNHLATENILLMPGEMATFRNDDSQFVKSTFNFDQKVSWKDGILCFKNSDYSEIVKRLELWYGVDISTNQAPGKTWSFTGKFEKENLDNILNALQFGHGFNYEINGKKVELTF